MPANRRDALKFMTAGAVIAATGHSHNAKAENMSTTASTDASATQTPWYAKLVQGLDQEHDYMADITGTLPVGLRGTLYRNGPGLFERNGYRKGHALDGDGMIRAFDFTDGGVRFRNRFVRTSKFVAEEAAGRYLHATWGTRAPGGMLSNIGGGDVISQAGVTPVVWDGRLLAFDETGLPWSLDLETLETGGEYQVGPQAKRPAYKAHTKFDAKTGEWILVGNAYGRTMDLFVVIYGADGQMRSSVRLDSPRMTYIHDFFATERYVIINLHAVEFSPFAMLAGMKTFTESLTWSPQQGNLVMIVDKNGGDPVLIEAPASWMWHALNAYEADGDIVAEFVGYDTPDHFIGEDPTLTAIMSGRAGRQTSPGTLRRWHIDLSARKLTEETLDPGHFEFPIVDPRVANHQHQVGYLATSGQNDDWWHGATARIDMASGRKETFDFGHRFYAGEPVFAADPNGGVDQGWLLVEVFDGNTERSSIAVLDAERPADGPVAIVRLQHHLPLSFHGTWHAA